MIEDPDNNLICLHPLDAWLARHRFIKGMVWMGTFSYSIYLTHMLSLGLVNQAFGRWVNSPGRFGIMFATELVVAVAAAYPFFMLFERPFLSGRAKTRVKVEQANTIAAAAPPIAAGLA